MSYIPLIEKLSELDKERIKNYLYLYGNKINSPLPPEEWLKYWEHSNQKLYKALGDTFIKEISNFKVKKDKNIITKEFSNLIGDFQRSYNALISIFDEIHFNNSNSNSEDSLLELKTRILSINSLKQNKILITKKIKFSLIDGKIFQLQPDMKIIKAINKIFDACKDYCDKYNFSKQKFLKDFENFKKNYSIVLNEQYFSGTLCFSIHPLDYLTMSDNSLRWNSCMSWTDDGCYRVGTIEMMNSNNVICAYIKSDSPYIFSQENSDNESYFWNNKKWRQLFYVTKDIIVNGKSYPFAFDDFAQARILTILHDLVEKNLNWHYEYGPESYMDMIHIHSKYRMDKNRMWMKQKDTFKHNILFDTKGMYNDILNDTNFAYLCFRNKVKQTKIISISGKANCICCNKDILRINEDDTNDYNERYKECKFVICKDCTKKIPRCDICSYLDPKNDMIKLIKKDTGEIRYICQTCANEIYKICACCGEIFHIQESYYYERLYYAPIKNDYLNKMTNIRSYIHDHNKNIIDLYSSNDNTLERLCVCPKCINNFPYKETEIIPYRWIFHAEKQKREEKRKQYIKTAEKISLKEVVDPSVIQLINSSQHNFSNELKEIQVTNFENQIFSKYKTYNNEFI